ncbi:SusC/RagA family TonB-linked outer membrane protein [Algoriphagus formosus]|uniref:SusC/RagA family TonB-linked outer membrane protein n=1 Tax=Algoriphagus formosus TaxID=2007308 RepID=UPI000C28279B|nr:SusC/RagA family TonB-linked outer membrane protein [Algoriphagus formosus]
MNPKYTKTWKVLIGLLLLFGQSFAQEAKREISGVVRDVMDRSPLPGVNLIVKGSTYGTVSDDEGKFTLSIPEGEAVLLVSYIGYESQEISLVANQAFLEIGLSPLDLNLQEVTVVSSGFQELPLSRSTGSYVGINQELVDRRVSTNLIDRLEDVTPGLIFNRDISGIESGESISIRGTSTLISSAEPLIVVDNLAYDGPLSSINPNDVESITVLKDAAAASIWGARAGNGVIVITTKQGKYGKPLQVNLTSNFTAFERVNPFYDPKMSINSLIDKQLDLYENGAFNSLIRNRRNPVIPPLAETLYAFDQGLISEQERDLAIQQFRNSDIRRDIDRYLRRPASQQQYALNLSGGSRNHHYQVSMGYDKNLSSEIDADFSRLTLSAQQSWKLAKERLTVSTGAYWVQSESSNGMPQVSGLFPYERLADEAGNPVEVYRDYSVRFKNSVSDILPLSWAYVPLEEIGRSNTRIRSNDLRLFTALNYRILDGLDWSVNYQYWTNQGQNNIHNNPDSYEARNLINSFAQPLGNGEVDLPVPLGGFLDQRISNSYSHNLRTQVNYQKKWDDHRLNVFAGGEIKDFQSEFYGNRSYGYLAENAASLPVDYLTRFVNQGSNRSRNIPFVEEFGGRVDRFVSAFGNLGYSFQDRFLVNASLRRDASNLFGVNTNQKSVPLWSAGLGWVISEEGFLDEDWIDFLKLRLSYGFNGNTNPNATAVSTARRFVAGQNLITRLPSLAIQTPPNPELRWERIKIINAGLDFEFLNSRVSGSAEYFQKSGLDLLGNIPIFISSGFTNATLNYASTRTKGWDFVMNTINTKGLVRWETNFFHSVLNDQVLEVENLPTANQLINYTPALPTPQIGRPLFSIYSFPFAGLDASDGAPLGIVEGEPSRDYSTIFAEATPENIQFHGSGRPTNFGAFRNTVRYKGFSLSANITYRLGYFVKRSGVDYIDINRGGFGHADYESRWQQPGDELITSIPADPGTIDPLMNGFYLSSAALVERGDHIRFQDLRIGYDWQPTNKGAGIFRQLESYIYINNLGILWKASKALPDPDFQVSQNLRSVAIGFRASF